MIIINNFNNNNKLKDGVIINNNAIFYRNTKPLTRIDNSSLILGDKWINNSTGIEGFWNGTYWLGQRFYISGSYTAVSTINTEGIPAISQGLGVRDLKNGCFITNMQISYRAEGVITLQNETNYKRLGLIIRGARNQIRGTNIDLRLDFNNISYSFVTNDYQIIELPFNLYSRTNDLTTITSNVSLVGNPNFALDIAYSLEICAVL